MKICENGIIRELTPEEELSLKEARQQADEEMKAQPPTPEERIAALEKDNAELREAMEALLSGVTA
jgi:hypothetical protein